MNKAEQETNDDWKKRALEAEAREQRLRKENHVLSMTLRLLEVAGHVDEERITLAEELASLTN